MVLAGSTKEQTVGHSVDGCGGADAESERDYGHDNEEGRAAERPQGVDQVAREIPHGYLRVVRKGRRLPTTRR